jgi:glucose/arabinose dehydrogenase
MHPRGRLVAARRDDYPVFGEAMPTHRIRRSFRFRSLGAALAVAWGAVAWGAVAWGAVAWGAVFSGAALRAQTPLTLSVVATGLTRPVFVTAPTGDLARIFIVEQPGRIRIVKNGTLLPTPFLDLTATGLVSYGGERGMLGLAFHPQYASNGTFYVYRTGNPYIQAVLERYQVSTSNPDVASLASRTVVLTTPLIYGNHNGGALAFGPDGYLYVAIGDGGSTAPTWPNDPFNHAQRGDSLLGKMLRLDVDNPSPPLQYGIPPSNPFAGPGLPLDEIWSIGLRNPWRCSFDRLTGDLYIADVGGRHEEIDFEPAGSPGGRNYGWSCMAGNWCNNLPVCTCFSPALTQPIHTYLQADGQAIIGGFVYRGCAIPDLRGSYFFADYMSDKVWTLRHNGTSLTQLVDRTAELVPPLPYAITAVMSFGEDAYGELYVCNLTGEVFKVVPVTPTVTGLMPFGTGTPGCLGAQALTADCSPVVGNPSFEIECSNAPVSGLGLIAFADVPDFVGSDPLGIGLTVHVQIGAPFWVLEPMFSDANSVGRFAFPIPPQPTLAGMQIYAQSVWIWSTCAPTPIGWSSSAGLGITAAA